MMAADGKMRSTDVADMEQMFRDASGTGDDIMNKKP